METSDSSLVLQPITEFLVFKKKKDNDVRDIAVVWEIGNDVVIGLIHFLISPQLVIHFISIKEVAIAPMTFYWYPFGCS